MKFFTTLFLFLTSVSLMSFSQTPTPSVKVKIFFIGTQGNKAISERKVFSENKKYTFCFDSETFNNLELSGSASNLSITVTKIDYNDEPEKMIYYKSDINLKGKINFTNKDFIFFVGPHYFITIKQNENIVLFKGEIDSEGCL